LPGCGHAERTLQASRWQGHGAAHARGPRAQQASKLETRALFAASQGGTVERAGGNTCAPRTVRLGLKPLRARARIGPTPDHSSHWHRCQWLSQQYFKSSAAPPLPKLAIACTSWTNRNYLIALAAARSLATDAFQFGNTPSPDGGTRRASICILSFLISEMSAQRHRGVKSP
jgi:hypothetical protein